MHYCVLLFTEKLPTKEEIGKILEPYNDEHTDALPTFTWDWWQIGGRYSAYLKLNAKDNDDKYRWMYYDKDKNGRLFHSFLLNEIREHQNPNDIFSVNENMALLSMGYRDGYIYVDGAKISDLIDFYKDDDYDNELLGYICIDTDGKAIARSTWDGNNFVDNPNYDKQAREMKRRNKDHYVTILDIHD